jgi:predicted membrane channel-forming protein YqfA (hemolysin III family)
MILFGETKELNVVFYVGLGLIIISVVLQMIAHYQTQKNQ